ncbi:MAG: sigma-70 family RNA polymerase sigma factor [Myxococcales bacterium]|nr:sigma-70 family RNA polymerase sigma factor [Myxococcales bacterium]MDH5305906.1 sigma-70 family RNA polymerase sigma factor [Myxococcales bacterium]MDH5566893.1 sigma-70 family RNA polymerase sigma factor [Myxococcales bacterium]
MDRERADGVVPEVDERALLQRLRAGENAAFAELIRRHGGRLLSVARRFLVSEEDARDAVQEAFISAFRSIDRFEASAMLSTWLHRIVVNAALMKLRTRRRKPEQSIEELLPGFLENGHIARPASPWRKNALEGLEREETSALVREKIQALPEGYRNVLLLRDIEDFDTQETAQLMGISEGAVKTRLHRARLALRELLEPHLREASE